MPEATEIKSGRVSAFPPLTCPLLFDAPLLFVSFSFPKEISWRIQWAPVLGESGCMYTRFPEQNDKSHNHITAPADAPVLPLCSSTPDRKTSFKLTLFYCRNAFHFSRERFKQRFPNTSHFVLHPPFFFYLKASLARSRLRSCQSQSTKALINHSHLHMCREKC